MWFICAVARAVGGYRRIAEPWQGHQIIFTATSTASSTQINKDFLIQCDWTESHK